MLSAPHPQPFSPEYRGEGSKNLFIVRTPIPNSLTLLEENIFIRPVASTVANTSINQASSAQQKSSIVYGWSLTQTIQSVVDSPGRFSDEFYWSGCLAGSASILAILVGLPMAVAFHQTPIIFRRLAIFAIAAIFFVPGPTVNQIILTAVQLEWLIWWNDNTLLAPILCLQFRLIPMVVAWSFWFIAQWNHRYKQTWAIDDSLPIRSKVQILLMPVGWSVTRLWTILVLVSFSDLSTYMLCLPPGVTTISMRVFELLHYGVRFQEAGLLLFIAMAGLGVGLLTGLSNQTREEESWL